MLAEIFYYAGFIESWGHGTIKIVDICIKEGLPEPDFIEENGAMTVVFYKDKSNKEKLEKPILGNSQTLKLLHYIGTLSLSDRQIKLIDYIKKNKSITLSSYKALIKNVSEKTLYRDIQDLVSKNILKEIGEKKGRKYKLV